MFFLSLQHASIFVDSNDQKMYPHGYGLKKCECAHGHVEHVADYRMPDSKFYCGFILSEDKCLRVIYSENELWSSAFTSALQTETGQMCFVLLLPRRPHYKEFSLISFHSIFQRTKQMLYHNLFLLNKKDPISEIGTGKMKMAEKHHRFAWRLVGALSNLLYWKTRFLISKAHEEQKLKWKDDLTYYSS